MSQQKSIEKPEVGASQSSPVGGTATGLLPGAHWAQLVEQESGQDESDNGLALGDNNSSTASLASTILEYRMLNGRRYHSERGNAQYWVSNDEQSNAALDINHHVMTLMYGGKLYKAPLKKDIQTAVDIGTGTGIWAIDFADEFPNTKVIGTDISAIQPSWIPPNLEFQIHDCTQEWTLQENSLDFVHMRFLVGSIVDWPALYKQAYRCLKPGGWIESHEASPSIGSDDGSVVPTSAMGQWGQIFFEGGRRLKRPFSILEDKLQTEGMKEAGLNLDDLQKDLDPSYIKERPGPRGARLYYLSGGDAVDLANRLLGPHRWSAEVTEVDRKVHEHSNGTKYSANITSKARVTVFWEGPGGPSTFHEDVGCGGGDVKKFSTEGEATELAAKEASTDAIKRALRFFGRALGGCFYDKEYLARIPQLKRAVGRKDEASRALLRPLLCKSTVQHLESGQTTLSLPSVKAQVVSEPTGGGVESAGKEEDEYYDDFDSDVEF